MARKWTFLLLGNWCFLMDINFVIYTKCSPVFICHTSKSGKRFTRHAALILANYTNLSPDYAHWPKLVRAWHGNHLSDFDVWYITGLHAQRCALIQVLIYISGTYILILPNPFVVCWCIYAICLRIGMYWLQFSGKMHINIWGGNKNFIGEVPEWGYAYWVC